MGTKESQFIDSLTRDLKPRRYWRAEWRTLTWGLSALLLNTLAMLAVQSFRPGFLNQLFSNPRFLIEILSAFSLTSLLIYFVFSDLVPGKKTSALIRWGIPASLITLALTLFFSFQFPSPESSYVGARAWCLEELLLYGLAGVASFCWFAFKSSYPLTRSGYFAMGLASAIVPGTLMQLSCMYSPKHGLLIHYGPILVIGVLVLATLPFIKSR